MSDDKERNFDITGIDLGGEIREDIIVLVQAEGDPVRDGAKDPRPHSLEPVHRSGNYHDFDPSGWSLR